MFGTGTAAIVSPVGNILYKDKMQSIPNFDDEKAVSQRFVNNYLKNSAKILIFVSKVTRIASFKPIKTISG